MIDIISKRKEESGFGEGRGEAEGMLGGARVKLIWCRMNRMKAMQTLHSQSAGEREKETILTTRNRKVLDDN